jgi:hypothetical protein
MYDTRLFELAVYDVTTVVTDDGRGFTRRGCFLAFASQKAILMKSGSGCGTFKKA